MTFVHTNVRNCDTAHLYRDILQNIKRVFPYELGYASFEGSQTLTLVENCIKHYTLTSVSGLYCVEWYDDELIIIWKEALLAYRGTTPFA